MMKNKKQALGLLITGATLLNVNAPAVFADENKTDVNESNQNKNIVSENSVLLNEEKKNLPIEKENKTTNNVTFYGKYDTLSEAEEKKNAKETEYKNEGYSILESKITNTKETTGHEVFDHYALEITTDAYTGKTKEEAEEIKADLEKDSNVTAIIKEAGEVYDHDDVSEFTEKFENQEDADNIIKDLENQGYTVSDVTYVYDKTTETVSLNETFDSEDKAKEALDSFKDEYQNVTETYDDIVENRDESKDTLVEGSENTSDYFDTEEAATEAMNNEISASENHDYYLTGTIVGPEETGEEELKETEEVVDKHFDSEDALNTYLEELQSQGYQIKNLKITHDIGKESESKEEIYETKEEAENALNEFKNEYNVTKEEITKVPDESENQTETYSQDFDNENEANSYKEAEEGKTTDDVVYTAEVVQNNSEIEELNEEFETREEAERAIAEFEASHDALDSESTIEEVEAGTIYNSLVITKDMKTYEVNYTTYIIIKHGKENVIWTEKELNSDEQNAFIESYKEHQDTVVTYNKLKRSHVFISGYNENNYSGNGKVFTFYTENGKTYIKMESGAESRVIAGEFQPVNKYTAKASGHNISYTVNVTKVIKGYDYKLVCEGEKEVELDSLKASFTKELYGPKMGYKYITQKHNKGYTYSINATGEKEVTLESGKISGKKSKAVYIPVYNIDVSTKKAVYKTVYDDDYELNIKGVKNETTPTSNPQTSDNIIHSFILAFICTISLAFCTLKLKNTEEQK